MENRTNKKTDKPAAAPTADQTLVQSEIGKKLKSLYEDVVEQDIPDRFLDLLDKLDKSGKTDG